MTINMRSYTLLYSKIWKQVVAMVSVPVITMIPFIYFLTQYKDLNDTILFIIIYAALGLIILLTLFVVFKQAHVPAQIAINKRAIEIHFKKRTLFNWADSKQIPLDMIEFVSDDIDINHNGRQFFTIKVKNEWGRIILIEPRKAPPMEIEEFSMALAQAVEQFNQTNLLSASIRKGSFYTGRFGKILTIIFIAVALAVTIIEIVKPSSIKWYRLVWLYILAAYWAINFFVARQRTSNTDKFNG